MNKFLKQVKYLKIIIELHEEEIIKFIVSKSRNILYTLDRLGNIKVSDFLKVTIKNIIKLDIQDTDFFDIDRKEKHILFNKGNKIQVYNLDTGNILTLGSHSSKIKNLHFSDDGQLIISSTNKDYYVSIWHKKTKDIPLFILQTSFIPIGIRLYHLDKGIYHGFVYNRSKLQGYKLIIEELNPNQPIKSNFEVEFTDKNLLNISLINNGLNLPLSINTLLGNPYNLITKSIKYANNYKNFKNINSKISISNDNYSDNIKNNKLNKGTVLNDIEMNNEYNKIDLDNNELVKVFRNNKENGKINLKGEDKISLINIINNSIINNDLKNFEWVLNQKVKL
jgi:hypothetical protein